MCWHVYDTYLECKLGPATSHPISTFVECVDGALRRAMKSNLSQSNQPCIVKTRDSLINDQCPICLEADEFVYPSVEEDSVQDSQECKTSTTSDEGTTSTTNRSSSKEASSRPIELPPTLEVRARSVDGSGVRIPSRRTLPRAALIIARPGGYRRIVVHRQFTSAEARHQAAAWNTGSSLTTNSVKRKAPHDG